MIKKDIANPNSTALTFRIEVTEVLETLPSRFGWPKDNWVLGLFVVNEAASRN